MAFGPSWLVVWAAVGTGLRAAADLVLPVALRRVPRAPAAPLCGPCTDAVRSAARGVAPAAVGPRPPPPGMPVCRAGARFEGPLRLAVTAYKDEGRRDLRDDLGAAARRCARGCHPRPGRAAADRAGGGGARRARADLPRHRVAGAATTRSVTSPSRRSPRSTWRAVGVPVVAPPGAAERRRRARPAWSWCHALVHTRRVADQAHLDRRARADNLAGSMAVGAPWRGGGRGAPPACSSTTSSRPVRPSPRRPVRCSTPGPGTSSRRRVPRHLATH